MGDTAHVTPLAAADFFCLGGGGGGGAKVGGGFSPPPPPPPSGHKPTPLAHFIVKIKKTKQNRETAQITLKQNFF